MPALPLCREFLLCHQAGLSLESDDFECGPSETHLPLGGLLRISRIRNGTLFFFFFPRMCLQYELLAEGTFTWYSLSGELRI